ncbi:hypothetical protein HUW51_15425 [Adhaeribacter swui]|uniref:Transporter n=1 Tax=Adhaeribacter swui TaxID=2086471 RepID=A0A7G7GA60_9BACT|nr:hypothetical protein [Adhaeribacter swui]QNF34044.1 hypothetical protein HUW51_15425 [Adhaeribacter swui]
MKKILYLFILLFFKNSVSLACDICGCFMGITPYDNQSSIGVLHRYRSFNGYQSFEQKSRFFPAGAGVFTGGPDSGAGSHSHNGNPSDFEVYRATEIRAKYFVHQRIELNAFVPYVQNTTQYNNNRTTLSGLGDINLFAGVHVLRKIEVAGVQQRLIVGGGVKLPTGHYYRTNAEGARYPLLYQTGTGSVDYFGYVNYIAGYKKFGLSINSSYKLNGQNYYKESIANSSAHFANLFYRYNVNQNWNINPSMQFFYEFTKGEEFNGELTGEHKMNNALLGPGLDIYYKNAGINLAFQLPIYEEDTGHPASAGRLVLGFSYNFNQTKYLIKSK